MVASIQVPPDAAGGKKVHTVETVIDTQTVQTQVMIAGDRSDPSKQQIIDEDGAAFTAFSTGSPNFDAFALMLTSEPNLMAAYKFYEGDEASRFYKNEAGGATISADVTMASLKLATGTASGDIAQYFTNRRFCYRPGATISAQFTMKSGDGGKVNVRRRVGWFGDNNEHICFEMDGSTGIYISIHNALTGVTTRVPSSAWNGDRLDGLGGETNRSGETIDPLKNNIWWIDYQYLGAGAARFGTWINGKQVVCHTTVSFNANDRPFLKSPNLAFGAEQENVGITGSSSELHLFCVAITSSGYPEHPVKSTGIAVEKTLTSTSFTPVASFRCAQLLGSVENRYRLMPLILNAISNTEIVEIKAELNPTLTGSSWAESAYGVEYDIAATVATPAGGLEAVLGTFIGVGVPLDKDLVSLFPQHADGFHRDWLIANATHLTISARLLEGVSSKLAFNLAMEIRH